MPGEGYHFTEWCSHWQLAHAPIKNPLSLLTQATRIKLSGDQPNKPQKKTKDTLNEGEDLMGENRLVSVGVESEEDQCGMKMAKLYYI